MSSLLLLELLLGLTIPSLLPLVLLWLFFSVVLALAIVVVDIILFFVRVKVGFGFFSLDINTAMVTFSIVLVLAIIVVDVVVVVGGVEVGFEVSPIFPLLFLWLVVPFLLLLLLSICSYYHRCS